MIAQAPQIISQLVQLISGAPSSEEIILKQLELLQEMIGNLSKQVAGGLSHIDANLASLTESLEEDTLLLKNISTHIGTIENDVAHLEERLNALQADLLEIAKTQREEGLVADVDTDIGYSERAPGHAALPVPQFEQAVGAFFAWGTFDPFDAISELPSSQWATESDRIFEQLGTATSTDSLDFNLDYLAGVVDERRWGDGLTLSPGLPNPSVWADGANAFAQLLAENTEYVTEPLLSELADLKEVGASMVPELEKISEPGPEYKDLSADGVAFDTGSSILNHALVNYLEQGSSFLGRAEAEENYFLSLQNPGKEGEPNCSDCKLARAPDPDVPGDSGTPYIRLWSKSGERFDELAEQKGPSESLSKFETSSAGTQPEEGGARILGQVNACNTEAGEETNLGKQTKPGPVELEPTVEWGGASHPNPLLDPVPTAFANAWYLGLGHLSACYAASHRYNDINSLVTVELYWYWTQKATGKRKLIYQLELKAPEHFGPHPCETGNGSYPQKSEAEDIFFQEYWSPKVSEVNKCLTQQEVEEKEFPDAYPTPKKNFRLEEDFAFIFAEMEKAAGHAFPGGCFSELAIEGLEPSSVGGGWEACGESPAFTTYGEVVDEVELALKRLRLETYDDIAPRGEPQLNAANEDVRAASQGLAGARSLLDDYIQLGVPVSLADDPELGDLVYGPSHLLDDSPGNYEIFRYLQAEIEEAEQHAEERFEPPPLNPLGAGGALEQRMRSGAEALDTRLKPDIASTGPSQQVESGDELIPATDARLEIGQLAGKPEEAPKVTQQPASVTVVEPATATFTAEAQGEPAPTVQWEVSTNDGESFRADTTDPGNQTDRLQVQLTDVFESGYEYRARFENRAGSTSSLAATLEVSSQEAPTVSKPTQATTLALLEGETATLAAEASGLPKPNVQWEISTNSGASFRADTTDPGSTTNVLTIKSPTASETGNEYRARFENQAGSATSAPITITVAALQPPKITLQPLAQSVIEPHSATFAAEASGTPTPSVQWEVSKDDGGTWAVDSLDAGSTTDTLKIETTSVAESGSEYRAKFANAVGHATSEAVTLTVEKPPTPEFTIEATQEIKGSGSGPTTDQLTGAIGQTIDYAITVHNTGNVPLALENFSDASCADLAGGPGVSELTPGKSTAYSCQRAITRGGTYVDEASLEGIPPVGDGFPLTHTSNQLVVVGPNPSPTVETTNASEIGQQTATLNGTVNPHGGRVAKCTFQYGPSLPGESASCTALPGPVNGPVAVLAHVKGLAANTTYHFRVSAASVTGSAAGTEATFRTLPALAPSAETTSGSEVRQRTAVLTAKVNPNGGQITSCSFEYGTTSPSFSAPCSQIPGPGTSAVAVTASVSGLAPDNTYHFRIAVASAAGKSKGSYQAFTTIGPFAPTAETGAGEPGEHTALLNATVNPNGGVTTCKFEYGTSAFVLSAPCSKQPGSAITAVAVEAQLKGLAANTTYRFRIDATSPSGTSRGATDTFKTG